MFLCLKPDGSYKWLNKNGLHFVLSHILSTLYSIWIQMQTILSLQQIEIHIMAALHSPNYSCSYSCSCHIHIGASCVKWETCGYRRFSETCPLLTSILFELNQEIFKCMPSSLRPHLSFTTFQRDFIVHVAAVDGSRAPAIEASAGGGKRHMDCLGVSKQRQENEPFIMTVKSSWTARLNRKRFSAL